jgi:hypothetical protein
MQFANFSDYAFPAASMRSKKGAVIDARCTLVGEKGHPPVTHTMAHDTKRHLVGDYSLDEHTPHSHPLSLSSRPPPLLLSLSHSFGTLSPPSLSPHTHYLCCRVGACVLQLPVWIYLCWDWVPHGAGAGKQCKQCADTTLRRLNEELGVGEAEDTVEEQTQRRCCLAVRAASTTPVSAIPPPTSFSPPQCRNSFLLSFPSLPMAAQGDCGGGASKGTGTHGVLRGDQRTWPCQVL